MSIISCLEYLITYRVCGVLLHVVVLTSIYQPYESGISFIPLPASNWTLYCTPKRCSSKRQIGNDVIINAEIIYICEGKEPELTPMFIFILEWTPKNKLSTKLVFFINLKRILVSNMLKCR